MKIKPVDQTMSCLYSLDSCDFISMRLLLAVHIIIQRMLFTSSPKMAEVCWTVLQPHVYGYLLNTKLHAYAHKHTEHCHEL